MGDRELVLGVDIGGTNTAFGYVDREGNCLADGTMPTHASEPTSRFFRRLHEQAEALRTTLPRDHRLIGIGIGAPNANYYRRSIEQPPNLDWAWVDLAAELAPYYALPLAATNDANAAALGEMLFGAAKGLRDFIVITLGTGLGSGIVVNGELVYGSTGFAGELGHLTVDPDGRPCGCGRRGCLETYASATGLVLTARELLAKRDVPSTLHHAAALDARSVCEAARAGDAIALETFRSTGEILGRKLADAVAFSSPQVIFLFGGLTSAGDLLFTPVREALEANLLNVFRGTVQLLPSRVPEGKAAILGASALIWKELERGS